MTAAFAAALRGALAGGGGPVFVHADVFRVRAAVAPTSDPRQLLDAHLEVLRRATDDRPLVFPTFNYDFLRTGRYRPAVDPSQTGALTEHARTAWARARFGPPVFHACARDEAALAGEPAPGGARDPFDADSVFGRLAAAGGQVLLYGATLASLTALHHVERIAGGPVYRYDKPFAGVVEAADGAATPTTLVYHCRPAGRRLEYAWARLRADLEAGGVARPASVPGAAALVLDLRALVARWSDALRADPLWLLDDDSRAWVAPALDRVGRRFVIEDFEPREEST